MKPFEQVRVLPAGRAEAGALHADVLPGPPQELPAVRFAEAEHPGDLRVRVLENFAQEKHGALDRGQALQEQQHRHRNRFVDLSDSQHVASRVGDERFGQPLAHVRLALHPSGLQVVDAEAADDGDEKRLRRSNVRLGRALPADERVLQRVFRIGHASQHAVRDRKEETAMMLEHRGPGVAWSVVHQAVFRKTRPVAAWSPRRLRNRAYDAISALRNSKGSITNSAGSPTEKWAMLADTSVMAKPK